MLLVHGIIFSSNHTNTFDNGNRKKKKSSNIFAFCLNFILFFIKLLGFRFKLYKGLHFFIKDGNK